MNWEEAKAEALRAYEIRKVRNEKMDTHEPMIPEKHDIKELQQAASNRLHYVIGIEEPAESWRMGSGKGGELVLKIEGIERYLVYRPREDEIIIQAVDREADMTLTFRINSFEDLGSYLDLQMNDFGRK